jgi:hypothetical protein
MVILICLRITYVHRRKLPYFPHTLLYAVPKCKVAELLVESFLDIQTYRRCVYLPIPLSNSEEVSQFERSPNVTARTIRRPEIISISAMVMLEAQTVVVVWDSPA